MRLIMVVISSLFLLPHAYSQGPFDQKSFKLSAAYAQDGVKLVWTASGYNHFQNGINNGYTLKRLITAQNGVNFTPSQSSASVTILDDSIFPLANGDPSWHGDYGNAADQIIYYQPTVDTQNPNLADAYTYEQENIERYQYGSFISFLDFTVAQQMGLAYHDMSVQSATTYMYVLELNGTDENDAEAISTTSLTEFAEIKDIEVLSQLGKINVSWPIEGLTNDYFAYDILRSEDDVTFTKVNEEPYIFFQSGEEEPDEYVYQDTTTTYGTTYYYAMQGHTIFGEVGERSASTSVLSIPYMTGLDPQVEADDSDSSSVTLEWIISNQDQTILNFISGYNIYRSDDPDTEFELLTQSPISGLTYTDNNPIPSAYYIVATVDDFGQEYYSLPEFAQIIDHTPPATPINFSVRESSTNQYELTWTANTEQDLEGYLLYTLYEGSSNYIMISPDILSETSFIYNYPPDLLTDEICFKVSAIDQRGNQSDMSECVTVILPDNLPPSRPYMSKHQAIEGGIALGWQFSMSEDVILHNLQRKPTGSPGWESILKIRPNEQADYETNLTDGSLIPTCYIDSTYTELRSYDYRMAAVDEAENISYSTIVSLSPLSAGSVGQIENFSVSSVNEVMPGIMPQQDAYDLIQAEISALSSGATPNYTNLDLLVIYRIITAAEYEALPAMSDANALLFLESRRDEYWTASMFVTLSWDYNNLDQILYFQVYRSIDGRGYIDYIDILPEEDKFSYQYDDGFIMSGHRYLYKVMAAHAGGKFSEVSAPLLVRVN